MKIVIRSHPHRTSPAVRPVNPRHNAGRKVIGRPLGKTDRDLDSYAQVLLDFQAWCEKLGLDFRTSVTLALAEYRASHVAHPA